MTSFRKFIIFFLCFVMATFRVVASEAMVHDGFRSTQNAIQLHNSYHQLKKNSDHPQSLFKETTKHKFSPRLSINLHTLATLDSQGSCSCTLVINKIYISTYFESLYKNFHPFLFEKPPKFLS